MSSRAAKQIRASPTGTAMISSAMMAAVRGAAGLETWMRLVTGPAPEGRYPHSLGGLAAEDRREGLHSRLRAPCAGRRRARVRAQRHAGTRTTSDTNTAQ